MTPVREAYYPNLKRDEYRVTSNQTTDYNCIAHAAGRNDVLMWPMDGETEGVHWPDGVSTDLTVDSFVAAYGTEGYAVCPDGKMESGFEKVAIYVDAAGEPAHAARQLADGAWTSKLGDWEDIRHETLEALEDDAQGRGLGYGKVAKFLKRAIRQPGAS